MRKRSGFTLIEMTVVLVIIAIVFALVAPALTRMGDPEEGKPYREVADLLRSSRRMALERGVTVQMLLDPETGLFRVDSTGARGSGLVAEGELGVGIGIRISADSARAKFTFKPDGVSFGDSLLVRSEGFTTWMALDPWSGEVLIEER